MGNYKVMVVDDEPETLAILDKYLSTDYEVITCKSGTEAIAAIKENMPDVLVMDIDMPYMDGIETLSRIREYSDYARLPVIFNTGLCDKATVLRCVQSGASGYLVKPIQKDALLEKVSEVIDSSEITENKKTILIVDDEIETLKIIKSYLINKYNVVTTKSGREALEYLGRNPVDLVLLDYEMPLYSGSAVLKMIRSRKGTATMPVVFLSGIKDSSIVVECMSCRPDGYLVKPAKKKQLLDLINGLIG